MKKISIFLFCIVIPFLLSSQTNLPDKILKTYVISTGNTTGHIANLKIINDSKEKIPFPLDNYFIPSDGKHQGYIIPINEHPDLMIDPGETVIPLDGFCTDIRKPPIGNGEDMPPFNEWIPRNKINPPPKPGQFLDESIFKPVKIPNISPIAELNPDILDDFQAISTFPGTNIVFPYKIDIDEYPVEAASLLFEAINRITETYDSLYDNNEIDTPFGNNPKKQKESIIQQSFWIYTSILTGDPYDKKDFENKLEDQFKQATGKEIEKADTTTQKKFKEGVEQFWNTFELVGVKAKVIKQNSIPNSDEPKNDNCDYIFGEIPGFQFNMQITDSWKNEEERNKAISQAREEIMSSGYWNPDSSYYYEDGGLNKNPTSVIAFFKNNIIGGYASAYAKTYLSSNGTTIHISETKPLIVDINKSGTITLQVIPPSGWNSFAVGSSYVRLHASSSSFDAVAGNSENGLNFLRITRFAAKTALKYLIDCATGGTSVSFGNYAKEAIENELMSEAEQQAHEEINSFLREYFEDLINEWGLSEEKIKNMTELDLKAYIEDKTGIEINSLGDIIDKGLDAALNMFFVSNTYATANGGIVVKIGDKAETAFVSSKALYLRTELEDSDKVVSGTGEKIDSLYLSDVKPNTISIQTTGIVNMMTRAKGNGSADSYLESIQLQVLVGVCKSPAGQYFWNSEIITGAYYFDKKNKPSFDENTYNNLINDLNSRISEKLNYSSSMEDWKNVVDEFVKDKSKEYPFNK